ncbi:aldo/keto reductase [Nonomuraea rubra]|uniref:aldo/keto reductase n=1 Tax=Nonomuraea rubra TaxID=46180 RepID=UPI00361735E9
MMNAPLPPARRAAQSEDHTDDIEENVMQTRTLGRTGPAVSALGLGAMGMSGGYGASDRSESIATVHAALEAGVTLIDTGDFYGMGHNELLLAEALRSRDRDGYQLSVKFGQLRGRARCWAARTAVPRR